MQTELVALQSAHALSTGSKHRFITSSESSGVSMAEACVAVMLSRDE